MVKPDRILQFSIQPLPAFADLIRDKQAKQVPPLLPSQKPGSLLLYRLNPENILAGEKEMGNIPLLKFRFLPKMIAIDHAVQL